MRIIQRMMKLFHCRAVLVIVGMAAMTANATLRTWVGASGGSWYAAENWDPSGVPAETDTVVFRPDSELTVTISATSGNNANCHAAEIRFESGKTTFAYSGTAYGIYMGNPQTNILYVAGDAEVVVSNRFMTTNKTRRLRKTGSGKLTIVGRSVDWWVYSANNRFAGCDFVEGETVLAATSGADYPLESIPIHVCSGAVVRCTAHYNLRTTQPLEVDYGGVLDLGGMTQYAKSVTGEGVVTNLNAFKIYLTGGVCTFAGRFFKKNWDGYSVSFNTRPSGMSDEDWGFVIGASNTFAASRLSLPSGAGNTIRFAPGIGEFWIRELDGSTGQYLTLEDTNGDPVTVRGGFYNTSPVLRFSGSGNFLCSMSGYIRSSAVVANMTGALGACNDATLTIGNDTAETWPGISGLGGFIVERGTVAFKNKNVEDSTIHGTTVFRDADAKMTATDTLTFGAGSTVRFEIATNGFNSGVVPIKAPDIVFDATSTLEADVATYRETLKKKTTLMLAEATSTLNLPDEVLANANASNYGHRFRKDGKKLLLDVSKPGGFIITFH